MAQLTREDLVGLLRPQFGKDLVVESITSKPLTKPGENYGSTILAIEATIQNGEDKTSRRNLSLVAKLVPPSEFLWKIFDPENTVCKEIHCYTLVNEEFKKLQNENSIPKDKFLDVFPKCYGARTTLSPEIGDKADKNGAILLENLKLANYRLGDQKLGLDIIHGRMVVSHLARFHALSIALKILKPQVFKDTILKACKPHILGFTTEELENNIEKMQTVVRTIPGCEIYLDRIRKVGEKSVQRSKDNSLLPTREPYGTLCHLDFWVNNMMFCYDSEDSNIPSGMKFVDFQGVLYSSPMKDLIFFLYSSLAEGVCAKYYDELIQLYHENFTNCLKSNGCDISQFTFQSLLEEIEIFAPPEADHILFMLIPICADKSELPELAGVNFDTLFNAPSETFKRRAKEFIIDFAKRGWL